MVGCLFKGSSEGEGVCLDTACFCGPGRFVAKVQGSDRGHSRWWNVCNFRRLQEAKSILGLCLRPFTGPEHGETARRLHKSLLKMEQSRWSPRCVWAHTCTWNMSDSNELHWAKNANTPPDCLSITTIFWNWYFYQIVQRESCFFKNNKRNKFHFLHHSESRQGEI